MRCWELMVLISPYSFVKECRISDWKVCKLLSKCGGSTVFLFTKEYDSPRLDVWCAFRSTIWKNISIFEHVQGESNKSLISPGPSNSEADYGHAYLIPEQVQLGFRGPLPLIFGSLSQSIFSSTISVNQWGGLSCSDYLKVQKCNQSLRPHCMHCWIFSASFVSSLGL